MTATDDLPQSRRLLPLLLLLFVGSGCAALIYEIVWFQLLELIIGSSAISIGVLLATFMGGMCLGSIGLARVIPADRHPLRVYAAIEFGIGVCGLLVLWLLPYAGGMYVAIGGHGIAGLLFRGALCALCLLLPTVLMGATLPAISRWIETTPRGVSWLGFLYGGNTGGAVIGCLLAGFYLLRVHDMAFATYVAVAINAVIGLIALTLSRREAHHAPAPLGSVAAHGSPATDWPVLVTIALSGFTALGAEVVWTRLLSLLLGATVYTFSLILAAFLFGIGLGSWGGSLMARSTINPRTALGWCQGLLVIGIAWAAYCLTASVPYWPVNPTLSTSPLFSFQLDLARCLWTVLPAALLWGASFPLALAALTRQGDDPARGVGLVYAANTVGAILGSLGTSLLVVAWIGTEHTQQGLIGLAAASALLLLLPSEGPGFRITYATAGRALVPVALGLWLMTTVKPVPGVMVGYGRFTAPRQFSHGDFIYIGEGMNSTVAVSKLSNGVLNYHNAGKVQASSEPQDLRLERMLGHLTTLVPEHPTSVLVIGFGAGVTAGAVSIDPAVQEVTIAEIEPLVPKVAGSYFAEFNDDVAHNPKVKVVIDDGRHYLLTSRQRFDAITSDPFDPWTKGAATLYTREFFELVRKHLNPGGVVTVWVPLYETNIETVKSEIATFMSVFPDGIVWGNTDGGRGYDIVLSGRATPTPINLDAIDARMRQPAYAPVARSLGEIGFTSLEGLFGTYAGRGTDLRPWLADAQLNHDRDLRLQYLAGLGLNLYDQDRIYQEMLSHRRWPEGLFAGDPAHLESLRAMIEQGQ